MNALLNFVTNSLFAGAGAGVGLKAMWRATQNLQPYPLPHQFSALLELSWRQRYLDPGEVLGLYGVNAGMTVLDAGCGTGLFTVELARMVGETGCVYAVDIQAPMVIRTRNRVHGAGVAEQVRLQHAGFYDLPLADNSIDLAVLISTFGEIPDKPAALSEFRRVLKPGARLAVTEELLFPAYLLAGSVHRWATEAGFQFLAKTGSPLCHHTVFINDK